MPAQKKIPVIDNDPASTRLVRLTLERLSTFAVRALNDPARAVRIARAFRPGLVLLDVEMTERDGGEVARNLQTDAARCVLPIISMPGLVTEEETVRCVAVRPGVLCATEERGAAMTSVARE